MAACSGGLIASLSRLPLLCLDPSQLIFEFTPPSFQTAGHLGQQIVSVFDSLLGCSPGRSEASLDFEGKKR